VGNQLCDPPGMATATAVLKAPGRARGRACVGRGHAGRLTSIEGTRATIAFKAKLHGASDEQLLAFVVAGREARRGEAWDLATAAWRHLAARHHDRVRGLVVAFRFPGHADVRIAPDEYDDAAQECFIRAVKML